MFFCCFVRFGEFFVTEVAMAITPGPKCYVAITLCTPGVVPPPQGVVIPHFAKRLRFWPCGFQKNTVVFVITQGPTYPKFVLIAWPEVLQKKWSRFWFPWKHEWLRDRLGRPSEWACFVRFGGFFETEVGVVIGPSPEWRLGPRIPPAPRGFPTPRVVFLDLAKKRSSFC